MIIARIEPRPSADEAAAIRVALEAIGGSRGGDLPVARHMDRGGGWGDLPVARYIDRGSGAGWARTARTESLDAGV